MSVLSHLSFSLFRQADDDQLDTGAVKSCNSPHDETCDLIYWLLHALLLRRHGSLKRRRLDGAGVIGSAETPHVPPMLQPILDLLQYRVFCDRIKSEIDVVVRALSAAGIPSTLRFEPLGETGSHLVQSFDDNVVNVVGGEAVLRVDSRYVGYDGDNIDRPTHNTNQPHRAIDLYIAIVTGRPSVSSDPYNLIDITTFSITHR